MATKQRAIKPAKQRQDKVEFMPIYDPNICNTSLGSVKIYNLSGNIQLQQEIDNFFRRLKERYL